MQAQPMTLSRLRFTEEKKKVESEEIEEEKEKSIFDQVTKTPAKQTNETYNTQETAKGRLRKFLTKNFSI